MVGLEEGRRVVEGRDETAVDGREVAEAGREAADRQRGRAEADTTEAPGGKEDLAETSF